MKQKLVLAIQKYMALFTRKLLGPYVKALIVETDYGFFAVDPEDYGVGRHLRMRGNYGLDEIERLKPFITSDTNVLIVGAHIGTLAIPLSRLCKKCVAIEANPHTYQFLKINVILNYISNCITLNIAANDKNETIKFLLSRANSGGSKRVPKKKKYMYYYDNPEEISVKAYHLDEYLNNDEFDIILMDIEGSEYFALQGMQKILSKAKVLSIEFLPHHIKNVSGTTVKKLLSLIEPHFSKLTIPTKGITVERKDFLSALLDMYEGDQGDEGIIFQKV